MQSKELLNMSKLTGMCNLTHFSISFLVLIFCMIWYGMVYKLSLKACTLVLYITYKVSWGDVSVPVPVPGCKKNTRSADLLIFTLLQGGVYCWSTVVPCGLFLLSLLVLMHHSILIKPTMSTVYHRFLHQTYLKGLKLPLPRLFHCFPSMNIYFFSVFMKVSDSCKPLNPTETCLRIFALILNLT